jgi:hypothetical protein
MTYQRDPDAFADRLPLAPLRVGQTDAKRPGPGGPALAS